MIDINIPISDKELNQLKINDKILINGTIYTGRDAVVPKLAKMIRNNEDIPIDIKGSAIMHTAVSDAGISVVYIPSSESIEGIYKDIEFVASIVNQEDKGKEIVDGMKSDIEEISTIGKTIKDKKKVYLEIGPAPTLYSVGKSTFLNEMIEIIGAENIFANENSWISPSEESVIDANPDVILTTVNYVENPTEEIKSREGWEHINAVKNNQVYYIDSNSASRPTQNIIKALKEIAKATYPDKYDK